VPQQRAAKAERYQCTHHENGHLWNIDGALLAGVPADSQTNNGNRAAVCQDFPPAALAGTLGHRIVAALGQFLHRPVVTRSFA
jgi:hypothetical protein